MLKTGIWQLVELITIVYSVASAFRKHGQPMTTAKQLTEYQALPEGFKGVSKVIMFIITLALGPVVAYNGGCTGVWLLAYTSMSVAFYVYGLHLLDGAWLNVKYSVYRTVITMTVYNVLLYLGGFWTN